MVSLPRPPHALRPRLLATLLGPLLLCAAPSPGEARPSRCRAPRAAQHYECLGALRGRAGLVAALPTDRGNDGLLRLAARLGYEETGPALRKFLARALHGGKSWQLAAGARLAAELGDRQAVPALVEAVRRFESEEALRALEALGAPEAVTVARELLERVELPARDGGRRAEEALRVLMRRRATEALELIRPLAGKGADTGLSERVRSTAEAALFVLGDRATGKRVRKQMRRPGYVPDGDRFVAGLGGQRGDLPLLLRVLPWSETLALPAYGTLARLAAEGEARVRTAIRRGVEKHTALREDRDLRGFNGRLLALHHGVLARTGVLASRTRLLALAEEDAQQDGAWVAAREALALELPGAANAAITLLASGGRYWRWQQRALHVELLEAAVAKLGARDGRWAASLLDSHPGVAERAHFHLARLRPAGACEAVTAVLGAATRGVEEALLALTHLGDACVPALEKVVADSALPPAARGTALEVLAMARAPSFEKVAKDLAGERQLRRYLERARDIAALP